MTTHEAPARYFGRCWTCRKRMVVSAETHELFVSYAREIATGEIVYCPECGFGSAGQVFFKTVKATLVPDKKCDHKCRLSVSEVCKCSCGGAEHGTGPDRRS